MYQKKSSSLCNSLETKNSHKKKKPPGAGAAGEPGGLDGTPSVFVNGKHYNGSLDPQAFGEILKSELKNEPMK